MRLPPRRFPRAGLGRTARGKFKAFFAMPSRCCWRCAFDIFGGASSRPLLGPDHKDFPARGFCGTIEFMRCAFLVIALSACGENAADKQAAEQQKIKLSEVRTARWNDYYMPYINAACRDDNESLQCARARLDARKMFLDEDARDRQAESAPVAKRKQTICTTIGMTTICN